MRHLYVRKKQLYLFCAENLKCLFSIEASKTFLCPSSMDSRYFKPSLSIFSSSTIRICIIQLFPPLEYCFYCIILLSRSVQIYYFYLMLFYTIYIHREASGTHPETFLNNTMKLSSCINRDQPFTAPATTPSIMCF